MFGLSKYCRERRVSTRVRGLELNLLETCGLTNGELVRYGLRKYLEEHPKSNEYMVLTEIAFLKDKIEEYQMLIEANSLLIQEKIEELKEIRKEDEKLLHAKRIMITRKIYDEYLCFIDNEDLTEEFRSDLKNFYSYCRDPIYNISVSYGKTYEQGIEIFEEYLDEKFGEGVIGDCSVVECKESLV